MFSVGNLRRAYPPECKDDAVKLVINTGRQVATVALELGLVEPMLGNGVMATGTGTRQVTGH